MHQLYLKLELYTNRILVPEKKFSLQSTKYNNNEIPGRYHLTAPRSLEPTGPGS